MLRNRHLKQKYFYLNKQRGFSLIELIFILLTIGVLASMSITSFNVLKMSTAYQVVATSINQLRLAAESGTIETDSLPSAFSITQTTSGPFSDVNAAALFPGFNQTSRTKITAEFDPSCDTGACAFIFTQVQHCNGDRYQEWLRYGDGIDIVLEDLMGDGCA
ncbi:MAG TPA: type II secretion system protein [Oligoflexia bacterium]|nr:type II secretion system protein [Oligoflexia bacterium]HMP27642.1 type II secretion system protein [Oligoflexia bacterium]